MLLNDDKYTQLATRTLAKMVSSFDVESFDSC